MFTNDTVVDKHTNNLPDRNISALEFAICITQFFVRTHINVKSEVKCHNYGRDLLLVIVRCAHCAAGESNPSSKFKFRSNFLIF